MDLVSWSLNAVDQIFSTRRQSVGEPSCPDGTLAAGFTVHSRNKWKILCLTSRYIEDTEDVYIFGFLVTGFLLFVCLNRITDSWMWFWNREVNYLWFWNSLAGWVRPWRSCKLGSARTVHKFGCLDYSPLR